MQCVSHSIGFCVQVARIVAVWLNLATYILYNFESVAFETYAFYRIIGYKTHLVNTYLAKNLGTYTVVSFVCLKA